MPGLPRDAQGRAVLVTAIAMAVDLLVPWVVVDGTHRPVASVGAPVLAALPVLGAALVPLFNPALRRKPVYAALPMIVGALCVGAGGMLWMLLTYFSYQYSIGVPTGPISSGLLIPSAFGATPDVGMYLFILGGAVLIFTGYRLFLEAASGMRSDAAPAPIGVAPAFVPPPLAIPVYPALVPASVPLAGSTSQPLPGVTMDGVNGQPSTPLLPYTQQAAPPGAAQRSGPISPISPMSPSSATSDGAQPDGANAAAHNGALHVPLPGSAEWNEAPRQPEHMRPALGWQRGPRVRR